MIIVPAPVQYADISAWQTSFDPDVYPYPKISLRATFGTTGTDPTFQSRWQASAHLTRQAYDFAYPGDGVAAANHFLEVVAGAGGFKPGDEAMLDLEQLGVTPQQAAQIAPAWCRTVQNAQPDVRVLVYGNEWFIAAAQLTPDELPNVGLIVASYGAQPVIPPGWDHVCVWQYADNQPVPGFPAPVDINQVICPTGLDHLTIGDDVLNDADKAWISEQISNSVTATVSYIMGTRTQPPGVDAKTHTTLASISDGQYLAYHGDATHPGQVAINTQIAAVQERVASLTTGTAVTDPVIAQVLTELKALNDRLVSLSWTLKVN